MAIWKKQILGDLIQINTITLKKDYPHAVIEYVDISSVGTGRLDGVARMSLSKAPSRAKRIAENGDTILSTVRPNRRSFLYIKNPPTNRVFSTGFAVLSPKKIDGRYLYYVISQQQFTGYLVKNAKGAAYPAVDEEIIARAEVNVPDLTTQSRIASVLSSYDDLIENNEKRIKILEEMAQRLYTEWFVKFNLPAEVLTKAGFPNGKIKLVDSGSEFGRIPVGWEVKALGEVMHFVRGHSYTSEQISDTKGDYYIVNLKSFNRGGGFRFDGEKYYSGLVNDNQFLRQGDVVVAVTDMTNDRAVIARPARVPSISNQGVTFSADVVKMIAEKIPSSFIYYCLLDHRFTEATKQKANGANVLHLKPAAILEYRTVIPPTGILNEFEKKCRAIFGLIDASLKRNQSLTETRDLLIPQLVTGKRLLK